jgi:transcription initiation factor TFIID subunit 5
MDYLHAHSHTAAENALLEEIETTSPEESEKQAETIGVDEFVEVISVFAQKPSQPGENPETFCKCIARTHCHE